MNRNLLFTSLMLCCSVMAISQQAKHSCFTNNLIVGDSIRYDLVDIEKLCIPENDESTWDFSNLKYLGKEREESFYGKDSAKCMSWAIWIRTGVRRWRCCIRIRCNLPE